MVEEMETGAGEIRGAGPCETESGPEKKRTAKGDVDLVSKLELAAGIVAGGLDGAEGDDEMAERHGSGRPGGELRNGRRRPIPRSKTQRL